MKNRQIFGRQPVVWIAAIQAVLTLLVSFHALKGIGINGPDDVMLVAGVLNALGAAYLAFGTTETMLATLIEVFKAGAAFAAIYGLNLSGEQSGVAVLTITALFSLVVHQPKTSPQATLSLTPGAVLLAPETASPTYDAQDAGGVVSRGEQGNISLGFGTAILVTLSVFFALAFYVTAALASH